MPIFFKKKGSHRLSRKDQSLARLENFKKEISTDCHVVPLDELCERFHTDPVAGLTQEQAKETLKKTGPNALTPAKKKSELAKIVKVMFHGFSSLLWIGAGLCYLCVLINYLTMKRVDMDNVILGTVLIVVVVLTGSFMYYQERKSAGIMESFANMVPPKATVIRGKQINTILSRDIVVGDLVDIKFGDRIPADIRIIHCQSLKVDNSPITGESEPQTRTNASTDENFLETKNIGFFSTNVVEGTARGIVIACGDQTVMGHIAGLTARLQPNQTPMAKELNRFMKLISIWACILGIILGLACLTLKHTALETLLFVIGIIVANVPEGLSATVIVCLTVTAKKMAAKNCLIKKLESVETLGSTSIICSDKTGTLTQNKMTVCHVWFNNNQVEADLSTSQKKGKESMSDESFRNLMRCATLCNRAEFVPDQEDTPILQRKVRGDASEEAILKFVEITKVFGPQFKNQNPKLVEIPFSSATKYQISVHALENGKCLVVMKGAPEVILERCNEIFYNNETKTMDARLLNICNKACTNFAEMGERVLGFCDLELEERFTKNFQFTVEPANFPQRGLRFLGLISMIDPPRPQVPDAIKKCQTAGIKVAMVTGDHPITAKAIAIKVGIITESTVHECSNVDSLRNISQDLSGAVVIHGAVLRNILQEELDDFLYSHPQIVFARTSPTQKLQIVESYQRLGEIVAVTGDGVNDAPALKKADIGIAMGVMGTEVSQQAADIILLDDNFASIITGIEEGRKIFDNLKKSITYTLTSNAPEIFPFIAYSFLGVPLPLGVIAILSIDLLTDMMPAISLAYEKAESDIMLRPPRNPQREKLVSRKLYFLAYGNLGMIEVFGGFFIYFIVMAEHGFMPNRLLGIRKEWEGKAELKDSYGQLWTRDQRLVLEQTCYTAFLMAVVITQWTNLIACKTRLNSITQQGMGNMILNVSLVVETIFLCILSYCPYTYYLKFFPLHWRCIYSMFLCTELFKHDLAKILSEKSGVTLPVCKVQNENTKNELNQTIIECDRWLYALPYAALLLCYDEFRKWHIRTHPKGWYQRETFY